jgi:undecaprenyl-diphosphatase
MTDLDSHLFLSINEAFPSWLAAIFLALTQLGGPIGIPLWLVVMAWVDRRSRARRAGFSAGAVLMAMAVDQALKYLIARARPWSVLPETHVVGSLETSYSFPSGHTTASFALAMAATLAFPRLKPWPLVAAALVGFSRIVVGMHYPGDVLAGAWLGTLVPLALYTLARRGGFQSYVTPSPAITVRNDGAAP